MKCESCGSDLSIENAYCPHCGCKNEFYAAHRADMDEYEKKEGNHAIDIELVDTYPKAEELEKAISAEKNRETLTAAAGCEICRLDG